MEEQTVKLAKVGLQSARIVGAMALASIGLVRRTKSVRWTGTPSSIVVGDILSVGTLLAIGVGKSFGVPEARVAEVTPFDVISTYRPLTVVTVGMVANARGLALP